MAVRVLLLLVAAIGASVALAQTPGPARPAPRVVSVDRVVAVVNDEAITQHDLNDATNIVLQQMQQQKLQAPPADVLERQVLERLVTEKALMQYAKETGLKVDDTQVERTVQRIAQDNKLSVEDFRKALAQEHISYAKYRDDIRNEIIVQRLREREVENRLTVTDAEVDQYLATLKLQNTGDTEYQLAHILVIVPEQASAEQIEAKRRRAEEALKAIRAGGDFAQVAAGFSDASDALRGGNLGWRPGARLPTVFVEQVRTMGPGDVSPVLRSAAGFHIVKLLDKRGRDQSKIVEQTHARMIVIKVNELMSESDAKAKIDRIKDRLDAGGKFEELAKLNSEDASAAKGGDLGWISPGDTVGEFQEAMNKLAAGQVSPPVRSPFGWHLIQVVERRKQDVTAERERIDAQLAIRQRKADELFQDWVRQTRDRAYVEIRLDDR